MQSGSGHSSSSAGRTEAGLRSRRACCGELMCLDEGTIGREWGGMLLNNEYGERKGASMDVQGIEPKTQPGCCIPLKLCTLAVQW